MDGAGLAVLLDDVAAAACERHQLGTQQLLLLLGQDLPDAREQLEPGVVRQVRVAVG